MGDILDKGGLDLYEKWFEHLKQLNPGSQVGDMEVRDEMLGEIIPLVTEGNSLILGKKDKLLIEELLNKFLRNAHLLK